MNKDQSNKNLKNASFRNVDLSNGNFSGSDLRGADFSGSNLTGADLKNTKIGITPASTFLIFLIALIVSALSGYLAMLAGQTTQIMLASEDANIRNSGILSVVIAGLFIFYALWKGGGKTIRQLVIPILVVVIIIGAIGYFSGLGTGMGMFYLGLSVILVTIMMIVGTVARTAAGALSNILFIVVAIAGSAFSNSLGGGIGTMVLAVSCGLISKKSFKNSERFGVMAKISASITRKFGTSFKSSNLTGGNFSKAIIKNADFSNADLSLVIWGDSKKNNCLV
jgi:hypothetical protein